MIREAIAQSIEGRNLSDEIAREVMREIMDGEATPAQIGALLTAMRMKGETVNEIVAFAQEMRKKAIRIHPRVSGRVIDTCGTGGDGLHTFNISTTAMFVTAGTGVLVAKHGNRSVSSSCGSADVLEYLGARLDLQPLEVEKIMESTGICFMFAPIFHPAMKHAIGPRREIGVRTFFNVLGPLTNPCNAKGHVLGVYDGLLTEKLARVALNLGLERVFVVHGQDGLDEISTTGATLVSEVSNGDTNTYTMLPEDLGIKPASLADLKGGDTDTNARIMVNILAGRERGPKKDAVVVNAAAGIAASSQDGSIPDALPAAYESIESGKALKALSNFLEANGLRDKGRLIEILGEE